MNVTAKWTWDRPQVEVEAQLGESARLTRTEPMARCLQVGDLADRQVTNL